MLTVVVNPQVLDLCDVLSRPSIGCFLFRNCSCSACFKHLFKFGRGWLPDRSFSAVSRHMKSTLSAKLHHQISIRSESSPFHIAYGESILPPIEFESQKASNKAIVGMERDKQEKRSISERFLHTQISNLLILFSNFFWFNFNGAPHADCFRNLIHCDPIGNQTV
jgi:hypothetical protein